MAFYRLGQDNDVKNGSLFDIIEARITYNLTISSVYNLSNLSIKNVDFINR